MQRKNFVMNDLLEYKSQVICIPDGINQPKKVIDFLYNSKQEILELLNSKGFVLIRGALLENLGYFKQYAMVFINSLASYVNRSTVRTEISESIYTSTEYNNKLTILQHCECSYSKFYPKYIMFGCVRESEIGGATPIADMSEVTKIIPCKIKNDFILKNVKYIRTYHPHIDQTWQTAFQVDTVSELEQACHYLGLDITWLNSETLQTTQIRPAMLQIQHDEKIWFNQSNLYHTSALGEGYEKTIRDCFGKNALPRHAVFGDDSEIPSDYIKNVNECCESLSLRFRWKKGDLLLLDNYRVAHGRDPFEGDRKIIVAMGD